jgi:dihydrofolate reductase
LFGGGDLFRSLLDAGQVDSVEPAVLPIVLPIVLGGGVPMFPAPGPRRRLVLTRQTAYESDGMVLLEYAAER